MRRVLVFLRYPDPGRVKTRLIPALGEQGACALYRACVELTLARLGALRREAILCVDPPEALERVRAWFGSSWTIWPQVGADLGERLAAATGRAFREGAQRLIVIGTDSPWLRQDDIEAAFGVLDGADVVLGPAEDGGYYLIGFSRHLPQLFNSIAWSTPAVFQQTVAHAQALQLETKTVRIGYDVDRAEDVARFLAEERRSVAPAPRQVELIERLMRAGAVVSGRERCRN